jgi:hypothetical protein
LNKEKVVKGNLDKTLTSKDGIPSNKNIPHILRNALEDPIRKKYGLAIVFNIREKHPGFKQWQTHSKENQTENDIIKLYNKRKTKFTSYSYYTGIGGLIDIDFDWEWTYHVALRSFGERFNTRTFKTPNGGYRCLYIVDKPKDSLEYKERPPYVEIHGNKGKHHVIVFGKGQKEDKTLGEYQLVNDINIIKDNNIITDMIHFLGDINKKSYFLEYNCIKDNLKHKKNHLTQDQRTSIGAFFVAENIDKNTAIDFFRTCTDFDYDITQKHLDYMYNKDFKHPMCETLKKQFNWNDNDCKKCPRKNGKVDPKNNPINEDRGIDLSNISQDKLFSINNDGNIHNFKIISKEPIFELGNNVYYVIPLKPQEITDQKDKSKAPSVIPLKYVIGVYGLESGYGFDPIDFYTDLEGAKHNATIMEANILVNPNQQRIIEMGIKEALDNNQIMKRSPELLLNNLGVSMIENIVNEIRDKIAYYIKLEDDLQYTITTCFILGTYLFPLFSTFGYLIISGEKGVGKGTFLDVMGKTCWNATNKLISVSEAVLFRRIAEQRPTLIIDEYHRAVKNKNSGNALISILESGYEKGGAVPRVEDVRQGNKSEYKVVDYPVYCPKILATRQPVEADDKGIKMIIPKLSTDQVYAKRKKELQYDPFFEDIRLKIMKWCITNQNTVFEEYKAINPNEQLNGREFNVWLPVLAIVKVAFSHKYEEVLNFVGETVCNERSTTYEKEHRVLTALYSLFKDKNLNDGAKRLTDPSYKITNKEINNILQINENEGMHHNTIKSAMDNLNLVGKYETGTYWIKKAILKTKLKERGYLDNNDTNSKKSSQHLKTKDDTNQELEPSNNMNFEDIPVLNNDSVKENEITESYNILIDKGSIALNTFVDMLEIRTDSSHLRCWGVFNYLKYNGYVDFKSEGCIQATNKFREVQKTRTKY